MSSLSSRRVLSIQSHVVSGYVGNKSATFPLQLLGFDVDAINSVQFSNHTNYGGWSGERLNGNQLWDLLDSLKKNMLLNYTHLLTGYIGSVSFLENVVRVVTTLRDECPDFCYVCDPVLGDNGKLYVPAELVPLYRSHVVPLANILTPNQFEAEQLTGITISSEQTAFDAMEKLHVMGVNIVVLTSLDLGEDVAGICILGSVYGKKRFRVTVPRLPMSFVGSGDLFAALLLAWTHAQPDDLPNVCKKVATAMHAVLLRTYEHASLLNEQSRIKYGGDTEIPRAVCASNVELRLIQSRADIINPPDNPDVVLEIL